MRKMAFILALILSLSAARTSLAAEAPAAETEAPAAETEAPAAVTEAPAEEGGTNPAVGGWYRMGIAGVPLNVPLGEYYIYPNGTFTNYEKSEFIDIELAEDGSFTVDPSILEGVDTSSATVTGELMPLSQETLDEFGASKDLNFIDYSENAKQLILTMTYPDPSNPLASAPVTTTVLFLRLANQDSFLEDCLFGKIWTIGANTLEINAEGTMNLNSGATTGECWVNRDDQSQYINGAVIFSWDNGGTVKYAATLVAEKEIQLQNLEKPEEILVLEYTGEAAPVAEEAEETEAAETTKAAE